MDQYFQKIALFFSIIEKYFSKWRMILKKDMNTVDNYDQ